MTLPGMRPWLLRAAALAAIGLMPTVAAAASADARQWLSRMRAAAVSINYEGTLVHRVGGGMSTSRVWHYRVGKDTFERLETQDGRQQRILRHNDDVRTVWPQTGRAVVERRETLAAWSTTPQAVDPRAADSYTLQLDGEERVAGRPAAVLVLMPKDALRFKQRFFADQATGLLLRADVLADDDQLIESSSFSDISLDVKARPDTVLQAMRSDDGLRISRPRQRRTTLEAAGWQVVREVPGFMVAGTVLRGLEAATDADAPEMLQVVFSDGLAHVSVFIERYNAERHLAESQARMGATHTAARRAGEHWLTVVGDVPPAALKQFAEALERRR